MFGFVPQILKIYRTESVADVSLFMLPRSQRAYYSGCSTACSVQDIILIISNAVSFLTLIIAVGYTSGIEIRIVEFL